ncbi:MAG: CZB domain-containing protein [Gammaproteobacteria bacterium]|nr:CZB domain-containing protein [Gammaproteobacteria bacterium]
MKNISQSDFERIKKTIDKALQMHTEWYDNLIRLLLCQLPLPESITEQDAHKRCDFGCWLYSDNNSHIRQLPSFTKIEKLHEIMHDGARDMSLNMKANGAVLEEDYKYFIRNLSGFRNELTSLRERVAATMGKIK